MNLRRSISTNTHITITKVCRIYFLPRFILSFFICSHSSVKLISGSVLLTVDTYIVSMRTHRKSAASFFLRFFFSRFLSFSRFLFFSSLSLSLSFYHYHSLLPTTEVIAVTTIISYIYIYR